MAGGTQGAFVKRASAGGSPRYVGRSPALGSRLYDARSSTLGVSADADRAPVSGSQIEDPSGIFGASLWQWCRDRAVLNGSDVSRYDDLSGRANHVPQSVAANQPLWVAGEHPYVDFSTAAPDYLFLNTGFAGFPVSSPFFYAWAVVKIDTLGTQAMITAWRTVDNFTSITIEKQADNKATVRCTTNTDTRTASGGALTTALCFIDCWLNGTTGDLSVAINGATVATFAPAGASIGAGHTPTRLYLGVEFDLGKAFDGRLYEFGLASLFSASALERMRTYLETTYGL